MDKVEFIKTPWVDQLLEFVRKTEEELIICVPFFDYFSVDELVKKIQPSVKVKCILGFNQRSLEEGGSNLRALRRIIACPAIEAKQITNLHAKTYISDKKKAIVTSGNLTKAGLSKKIEFGILIEGDEVERLHGIIMTYWNDENATLLDKKWLQRNSKILKRIEQELKKKKPNKSNGPGIGGHRVEPDWEQSADDTPLLSSKDKWAILVSDKEGHLSELISKGEGNWIIPRWLKIEKLRQTQSIYFHETSKGYVTYKGSIKGAEQLSGGRVELTVFRLQKIKPVKYSVFRKIKDGKAIQGPQALRTTTYVFDIKHPIHEVCK